MSAPTKRLLTIYMAALVAGLGTLNWWRATTAIDISPIIVDPALAPDPSNDAPLATVVKPAPSLADLTETIERPLFRSDRRRPAPKSETKPQTSDVQPETGPTPANGLRFIGTMRSGTTSQRALIRIAGSPSATWVEQGSGIGGWTVKAIEATRVVLQRNGDTAELELYAPAPNTTP